MNESENLRHNAESCAELGEDAKTQPERNRYSRMEAAWLALADEQDWLSGRVPPTRLPDPYLRRNHG
jgi:hypothetical protein